MKFGDFVVNSLYKYNSCTTNQQQITAGEIGAYFCTVYSMTTSTTHQSERAQNGERFVAGQTKLNQTHTDDEQVETVPALLEVTKQSECRNLKRCFRRENRRENLNNATTKATSPNHLQRIIAAHCCNYFARLNSEKIQKVAGL